MSRSRKHTLRYSSRKRKHGSLNLNEKYAREQEVWASAKSDFEQRYANLAAISKQWRLDLLVAQARLMQVEEETNGQITNLRKALAEAQFQVSMGKEKRRAILKCHKLNTLKMVTESIDKGWENWLVQAV